MSNKHRKKDTNCVKKDINCVKKDINCVIFPICIPYIRARVLELWNIEMLHQGREENPEKRYLGCLRTRKIQKIRPNEPKSMNEKQQRKKRLKGEKEYLRSSSFLAL